LSVSRPDAELVARCRAGDGEAFELLYREHSPRLFALVRRMTGSAQEGEDLLQEIFLQVHRKLDSFRGEAALGTWLYRLAIRHCLDFLRSRQARMQMATGELAEDGPQVPVTRETPGIRIDIERAVAQLPNGYRTAFVLHDVEGLEHKQIAELLGISENTSKTQVFKARLKLRDMLR
jgi:RNA polymerase sigma-70 factor (ECF subfamily)